MCVNGRDCDHKGKLGFGGGLIDQWQQENLLEYRVGSVFLLLLWRAFSVGLGIRGGLSFQEHSVPQGSVMRSGLHLRHNPTV